MQYGASAEYAGDRSQICKLSGDFPLDTSTALLLDSKGLLDLNYYYPTPSPIPTPEATPEPEEIDYSGFDDFFIGQWEGEGAEMTISAGSTPGQYSIEIIQFGAAGQNIWNYDAKFDNVLFILNCYNGSYRQESKFGIGDFYNGVGTAEITEIFHIPGNETIEYHCTYAPDMDYEVYMIFQKVW